FVATADYYPHVCPTDCLCYHMSPTELYNLSLHDALPISAVSTVVSAPGVELDRLIGALSKTTANVIMADADFMVDMHSHLTKRKADAEVVLKAYNKGLRREDRVTLDEA